ncbi:PEPxxWA-CTERM sorting domain-containing protein [Sphingomonas quercus]|nr:PEPxxWA-CTERM sorting domain-containing protein [Sphingomonas quercus]
MRTSLSILAISAGLAIGGQAIAAQTISDPTGDFASGYVGPHQADLDVTSFSVDWIAASSSFLLKSTMAGAIDTSLPGFYAIGVNTGTGPNSFASIGLGGVRFNQVIAVQKAGTATVSGNSLPSGAVTISGDLLSVLVPLSLLPSTGFAPEQYGFNIWPRSGAGGTEVISDFAPDNATLAAAVPEPATWATMLAGFGVLGLALRRRRPATATA